MLTDQVASVFVNYEGGSVVVSHLRSLSDRRDTSSHRIDGNDAQTFLEGGLRCYAGELKQATSRSGGDECNKLSLGSQ